MLQTYLNFNQLPHEQRHGGIQQMAKSPDEYRSRYHIEPITIESLQEDINRFDNQLAQQIMQNVNCQQANHQRFQRGGGGGRGRGRSNFRQRGQFNHARPFHPPPNQFYQQNNFHLPTTFRPRKFFCSFIQSNRFSSSRQSELFQWK